MKHWVLTAHNPRLSKQKGRLLIYLADSNTNKILPKKIIIKIIIAAINMWMVTMKVTRMIKNNAWEIQ